MEQSQVTEVEVVAVCKQARLMAEDQAELLQLSDDRIESIIQQWPAVASQIRINRRAARQ